MADRFLKIKDLSTMLNCSYASARRYLNEMEHLSKPPRVRESVVRHWIDSRTIDPARQKEISDAAAKKARELFRKHAEVKV